LTSSDEFTRRYCSHQCPARPQKQIDEPTDHQAVSKKSDENCSKVTDKFTIQLGSFLIDLKNNMKDESDVPWCKKLIVGSKQETQVQAMGNPT